MRPNRTIPQNEHPTRMLILSERSEPKDLSWHPAKDAHAQEGASFSAFPYLF
jgi:hypothetical protein